MPVLNRVGHLNRAVESVRAQRLNDVEVIVVDGGSTDGTREALASMPDIKLIDAPDSSIYEALNLGIKASTGELISHLNSDDSLAEGALPAVLAEAKRAPCAELYRGLARYVALGPEGTPEVLSRIDRAVTSALDFKTVLFGIPAINACVIRKSTYDRLGLYDERYRIASDREWLLRALIADIHVHTFDIPFYEYLVHHGSLTMAERHPSESRYAVEHLNIAAEWLRMIKDPVIKPMLYEWHAHEMMRFLLRPKNGLAWAPEVARAFQLSPAWPIRSIPPLLTAARRRMDAYFESERPSGLTA